MLCSFVIMFYVSEKHNNHDGLLTASEAAKILGVTPMTIGRIVADGQLVPRRQSGLKKKRRLFAKADIIALKKKYDN